MSVERKIKLFYRKNGLKLRRRHIKPIKNKDLYYNWLLGREGNLNLDALIDIEGIPLIKRYLKKLVELKFPKQPKLHKEYLKYLEDININYFNLVNQDKRVTDNNSLDEYERERWERQLDHPLINQKKLSEAKIVVFGLGGVGTNVLLGLIYAGVSNFKIIDNDIVELSNLNRQTMYDFNDIKKHKFKASKERLIEINPKVNVKSYNLCIEYPPDRNLLASEDRQFLPHYKEVNDIIKWGDIIINAVDYKGAPYLVNDLCVLNKKPFYFVACGFSYGHIINYLPVKNSPCIQCIYGQDSFYNDSQTLRYKCASTNGGVLGATVITTGTLLSSLVIHDICISEPKRSQYILLDTLNCIITKIPLKRDNKCECVNIEHKN